MEIEVVFFGLYERAKESQNTRLHNIDLNHLPIQWLTHFLKLLGL
jgi:hypothetical protein